MERAKRGISSSRAAMQAAREKLRNARAGIVSRSEQFELKEEEDIFEVVDEDKYAKLVEDRRNAGDFVVDDGRFIPSKYALENYTDSEGLGYHDDGEEHIGVAMDDYEVKKHLLQEAEEEDAKKLKKKAKYMQSNTMYNYAKTSGLFGAPSVASHAAQTSEKSSLDIDNLLGGSSGSSRRAVIPARSSQAMQRKSILRMPQSESHDYEYQTMDEEAVVEEVIGSPSHSAVAPESGSASPVQIESKESVPVITPEKISLSKPTRKLRAAEHKPISNEPVSLQTTFDLGNSLGMMSEIQGDMGDVAASEGTATASSPGFAAVGASIDPKLWLRSETGADGESKEEYMNMYWLDATELHGVIYLFGKVLLAEEGRPAAAKPTYTSCCVAIHGVERNLFVLPKVVGTFVGGEPVRAELKDVYGELQSLLVPSVVPRAQGETFRVKPTKRKYAFELASIPREETTYLKVVYSAKHGVPTQAQCMGSNLRYVEHIFGNTTTALELFLMKRKLMGPCWIKIKNPQPSKDAMSWCKLECSIATPKNVLRFEGEALPPPPLTSMCLSMKTVVNPSSHTHEIVVLSAVVHTNVKADEDTQINKQDMKRFTYVRQLGTTCGGDYPASFPHDIDAAVKGVTAGQPGVLQTFPNERALLSMFFNRVQQDDPDVFASHNLFGFEFEVLLNRAIANKLPGNSWSKIGRLRRHRPPTRGIQDRDAVPGRILCDTYKAAKEFLRETTYSLTHLSLSQLNYERKEVDPIDVPKYFTQAVHILDLAMHTSTDAFLVQRLMLKLQVVPLTKQLTGVSGNLWSRTARGARAERIEFLLMHEFHKLKYILPEKKQIADTKKVGKAAVREDDLEEDEEGEGGGGGKGNRGVGGMSRKRAKAAYAGGLVLEPKKGLYDTFILLLDFNSLYPSIIQEYDLCFTTVDWAQFMQTENVATTAVVVKGKKEGGGDEEEDEDEEEGGDESAAQRPNLPPLPSKATGQFKGVLPRVIKGLVDRRRQVKKLLKNEQDAGKRQQLDIRQKALKLTANSMYGCLGFTFSRFYARPIAALVTAMGRETLQRTVDIATNQMGLEVIYGDTDSVMINTNSTDLKAVNDIGLKVKSTVNKLYESLELDIDGIFKSMLLLKKKKYAAVKIVETIVSSSSGPPTVQIEYEKEMKGLDLVRRDWCVLSKEAGKYVLDQILSGQSKEEIVDAIHTYMRELATNVRESKVDLSKFVVTKGLNKNPKEYPDAKTQPHLQVALRMLEANKPVNIGDHIPYVICLPTAEKEGEKTGGSASNPSLIAQRAYHPDEIARSSGQLVVDYEWYLVNQILPPISRLCEPIEGTSMAILSQQLGLDSSKYGHRGGSSSMLDGDLDTWQFTPISMMDDAERFQQCERLMLRCRSCQEEVPFLGIAGERSFECDHCGSSFYGCGSLQEICFLVHNQMTLVVRRCLQRYYACWMVCDDRVCGRRTMRQSVRGAACTAEHCHGRMIQEYDERMLHNQLVYFQSLVDIPRRLEKLKAKELSHVPKDQEATYTFLAHHVANIIQGSAFNWVRPSLWTAMFAAKKDTAASNK